MCTVTYIPTGKGYIFCSNRDEAPSRSSPGFVELKRKDKNLLYPQDPQANGTWIAVSDSNQLVCILNGAFVRHAHVPPYRLSRGIMALDFFDYASANEFIETYDFIGIEPFTMIIMDQDKLYEFRWDGQVKYYKSLASSDKHIWASCTLYDDEKQQMRKEWFDNLSSSFPKLSKDKMLDFHENGGKEAGQFAMVMHYKGRVKTTSISCIEKFEDKFEFTFKDLSQNLTYDNQLRIQTGWV